ncbi:MAG: 30S ribosomal protein S3 [Candidatus Bathyarchaeota archaeon]|jgi:small subunit ribosomal protein S3
MSVVKHFIEDSIKKAEIDEFLQNEFERAGYGGVSITKTPLGTHLVIYTMRPGIVIGRGGETIRALATVLEENFQLPSPQISVAEIEIPELNAYVVASRIASALKRGVHYRRAGFWGLNQIMDAGALGAEVIISGKLRTDRARYEKFRTGYLPKSGEPPRKYMRKAELHVQTKPGILGVKVRLIPPDAEFPDQVKVHVIEEELEKEPERETVEKAATEEKAVVEEPVSEPATPPAKEKTVSEEKVAEAKATPAEEKKVTKKKKAAKPKAPAADQKAVKDKKAAKKKTPSAKKPKAKKKAEPKVAKPAAPAKAKAASKKKAAKPKAKPAKKKPATKKKVSSAKEKAAPKKKAAKSKVTPAKEKKKATKKKVSKTKSSSAKEKKEAKK